MSDVLSRDQVEIWVSMIERSGLPNMELRAIALSHNTLLEQLVNALANHKEAVRRKQVKDEIIVSTREQLAASRAEVERLRRWLENIAALGQDHHKAEPVMNCHICLMGENASQAVAEEA